MESYWTKMSASMIGTVAGFIFSICLFYITESVKRKRAKEGALKGLQREFDYNVALLDSWKSMIDKAVAQVASGDHQVFEFFPYSRYSRLFTQQAFAAGLIFEVLGDDEAIALEDILRFFSAETESFLNAQIRAWNEGNIDAKETLRTLHYNADMITKNRKALAGFKSACAA